MTTYIVKKNNRRIPNKVFESYEKARQWVRKKLRSTRDMPGYVPISRDRPSILRVDVSDMKHRTPELALHGYSISRVEG